MTQPQRLVQLISAPISRPNLLARYPLFPPRHLPRPIPTPATSLRTIFATYRPDGSLASKKEIYETLSPGEREFWDMADESRKRFRVEFRAAKRRLEAVRQRQEYENECKKGSHVPADAKTLGQRAIEEILMASAVAAPESYRLEIDSIQLQRREMVRNLTELVGKLKAQEEREVVGQVRVAGRELEEAKRRMLDSWRCENMVI